MRKVIYSKYVQTAPGQSWVLQEVGEAAFHQFGVDFEEFESGFANFSTAILELSDGQVIQVRADLIRFIDGGAE